MDYFARAKSLRARGEIVSAVTTLASALTRHPDDADGVEWLLHLYVEEVPSVGLESAFLRVLATQDNGLELLEVVQAELAEIGANDKLAAIRKTIALEELRFPSLPPAPSPGPQVVRTDDAVVEIEEAAASGSSQATEDWSAFQDPRDEDDDAFADAPQVERAAPRPSAPRAAVREADISEDLRREFSAELPAIDPPKPPSAPGSGMMIAVGAAVLLVLAVAAWALGGGDESAEEPPEWAEEGSG